MSQYSHMNSNSQPKTYESERIGLRYGTWSTALLIFKSTAGICYLNYHFAIAKVGLYLALIYNLFVCYLTSYGIYKVTLLANEIDCVPTENNNQNTLELVNMQNETTKIRNPNSGTNDNIPKESVENNTANEKIVRVYHELPVQLNIKYAHVMQIIILLSCASMSFASNISNLS